jgi:hypothetical protein
VAKKDKSKKAKKLIKKAKKLRKELKKVEKKLKKKNKGSNTEVDRRDATPPSPFS